MTESNPTPTPSPVDASAAVTLPVRPLLIAYALLAAVGFPLAGFLITIDLVTPALLTGAIVMAIAFISLIPLALAARATHPATAINALLGAVVLRLMLTAAGILGYLLSLPPDLRRPVGLLAIAWFSVSWLIELGILIPALKSRPQPAS